MKPLFRMKPNFRKIGATQLPLGNEKKIMDPVQISNDTNVSFTRLLAPFTVVALIPHSDK